MALGVEFNEEQNITPRQKEEQVRGILGFLIAEGFAKNKKQAEKILLLLTLLLFIAAAFVYFQFGSGPEPLPLSQPSIT